MAHLLYFVVVVVKFFLKYQYFFSYSFVEVYLKYSKLHTLKVCNLISFNICINL